MTNEAKRFWGAFTGACLIWSPAFILAALFIAWSDWALDAISRALGVG